MKRTLLLLFIILALSFGILFHKMFPIQSARNSESIPELTKKAEQGNVNAQLKLGYAFLKGQREKINYQKARDWFHKAANQGNPQAQFELGKNYEGGRGVKIDLNKAFTWYRKAALSGNVQAQIRISIEYFYGSVVPEDKKKSKKWFLLAKESLHTRAKNGDVKAQDLLGGLYAGVAETDKAAYWESKAAKSGNVHAQSWTGLNDLASAASARFLNMNGSEKIFRKYFHKGIYWLTKAASNGDVLSQMVLYESYRTGKDLPKNPDKANFWLQKLLPKIREKAKLGNVTDQYYLMGIHQDLHECARSDYWRRKATEGGWPVSLYDPKYLCAPK